MITEVLRAGTRFGTGINEGGFSLSDYVKNKSDISKLEDRVVERRLISDSC